MAAYNIAVTWMDGQQENYEVESYKVEDGELVPTEGNTFATRDNKRHVPLANVRVWKAER